MQLLVRIPECDLRDENNNKLINVILEQWKTAEVYRKRHFSEAKVVIEQLRTKTDSFMVRTYPFDLKVFRKDLDFNTPAEAQFDQTIQILNQQIKPSMESENTVFKICCIG